jgi:hypothetical protein
MHHATPIKKHTIPFSTPLRTHPVHTHHHNHTGREQEAREERERCIREGLPLPAGDPYAMAMDGSGYPSGVTGPGGRGAGGPGAGYPGDKGGSFDEGDPFTTNLYVGNLAPDVTEQVSGVKFSLG